MADELENEYETELPLWRPLSYEESGLGRSNIVEPDEVEHKKFILKCGNFVQAVYDAFNGERFSPTVGQSLYDMDSLFSEVKLFDAAKFKIHSFLYATTRMQWLWDNFILVPKQARGLSIPVLGGVSNWIGYVAYEKFGENIYIFVVIRGTITLPEWRKNITARAVPAKTLLISGKGIPNSYYSDYAKVHEGWLSIYETPAPLPNGVTKSLRKQIHDSVKELLKLHKNLNARVVVTGHSLGGAVATLTAYDLSINKVGEETEVTAIVFSTPKVGNQAFKNQVLKDLKIHHYCVNGDPVPYVPLGPPWQLYAHISSDSRVFLWNESKDLDNVGFISRLGIPLDITMHNLEVVLHLVAKQSPSVPRSPVLINKSTNLYSGAPANWWNTKEGVHYDEKEQEWKVGLANKKTT